MPAKNYSFAQYIKDEAAKIKRPPPPKGNKDSIFYSSNPTRDFIYDASSPRELRAMRDITSWEQLEDYLYFQNPYDGAMKAARTVWRRYERLMKNAETTEKEA